MSRLDQVLRKETMESDLDIKERISELDLVGENSEVKRFWIPEAFEWTNDIRPLVVINKTSLRLTEAAATIAGFQPGDLINIGVNKAFIAFRKDTSGLIAKTFNRNKTKKAKSLFITSRKLAPLLLKHGYTFPCHLVCIWDGTSNMLVAEKPIEKRESQK